MNSTSASALSAGSSKAADKAEAEVEFTAAAEAPKGPHGVRAVASYEVRGRKLKAASPVVALEISGQ